MIPDGLRAFLDDDTSITVEEVVVNKNDLVLRITLQRQKEKQFWRIRAHDPPDYELVAGHVDDLSVHHDHPCLWDYVGQQTSLYFNGRSKETAQLALDVIQAHYGACDTRIPVNTYLKCADGNVKALCERGFGLFAEGPKKVLDRYADRLREAGVRCSFVGTRDALVLGEKGWQPLGATPVVLSFGESWVISTSFEWEELG